MSNPTEDGRITLTDFLLARIAEDEAQAKAADWGPRWVMEHDLPNAEANIRAHIIHWDPTRVLAECEAKRAIVRKRFRDGPPTAPILALLALPYADHPDYRQEWKP